jgi:predicted nicotinamide N-methyase
MASGLPSESTAVQQKSYVTFTCLPPNRTIQEDDVEEPTLTLLERRHLISGSLTTGFRTWEAALHLGSYLLSPAGRRLIEGKSVLELGAGTGFLGMLAAKHLGAKHVTTTDGDEGVVKALLENMQLNGLNDEQRMQANVFRWGADLKEEWIEKDCDLWPYDVIVGADIVRILKANTVWKN